MPEKKKISGKESVVKHSYRFEGGTVIFAENYKAALAEYEKGKKKSSN